MPKIEQPISPIPGALKGLHLFHFDGAPCAQRVRFALGEKGLARGREEKFDSVAPSAVMDQPGCWVSRIVFAEYGSSLRIGQPQPYSVF